jgi:hypothetical protein
MVSSSKIKSYWIEKFKKDISDYTISDNDKLAI